ncbi:hypothetical protein VNO78_23730 [Psophocarpus tetragonolobus]|uniref:Uncharacterized protein n=1 Tax=Psophocarpus tetragonolobus TaxID=3891 RepID=A0AAN9XDV3_PSOTE
MRNLKPLGCVLDLEVQLQGDKAELRTRIFPCIISLLVEDTHVLRMVAKGKDREASSRYGRANRPVEPPLLTGSKKIGPHGFESLTKNQQSHKTVQHNTAYAIFAITNVGR